MGLAVDQRPLGIVGFGLFGAALAERFLRTRAVYVVGYDVAPDRRDLFAALGGHCADRRGGRAGDQADRPDGDTAAAHLLHLPLGLDDEVLAVEEDLAAHDAARRLGEQPEDGERGHGLARARLAHEAQRLALAHGEAHAVHRPHHAPARVELGVEVAQLEDDAAGRAAHRRGRATLCELSRRRGERIWNCSGRRS